MSSDIDWIGGRGGCVLCTSGGNRVSMVIRREWQDFGCYMKYLCSCQVFINLFILFAFTVLAGYFVSGCCGTLICYIVLTDISSVSYLVYTVHCTCFLCYCTAVAGISQHTLTKIVIYTVLYMLYRAGNGALLPGYSTVGISTLDREYPACILHYGQTSSCDGVCKKKLCNNIVVFWTSDTILGGGGGLVSFQFLS